MKSIHSNLLFLVLVACTLVGCANFSGAQTSGRSNGLAKGTGTIPGVSNEAVVIVETAKPPAVMSLESLREMPPPQIKLVFDCDLERMKEQKCEGNFSSELPDSLDSEIAEFWKKSIEFNYRDLVEKFPDAQTNVRESTRFSNEVDELDKKLRETIVQTNQGERAVSANEAGQLIQNINKSTAALVKNLAPPAQRVP